MAGQGGPNFPATISATQPVDRSVLAPPTQSQPQQPPAAAAANNWDFGWDGKGGVETTQPATIGNRYETAAISAGRMGRGSQVPRTTGEPADDRASIREPAGQPVGSQPAPTFGIGALDNVGWPESPAPPAGVAQREAEAGGSNDRWQCGGTTGDRLDGAPAGMPQNAATARLLLRVDRPREARSHASRLRMPTRCRGCRCWS